MGLKLSVQETLFSVCRHLRQAAGGAFHTLITLHLPLQIEEETKREKQRQKETGQEREQEAEADKKRERDMQSTGG